MKAARSQHAALGNHVYALVDQGLLSLGSFLIIVLLARWTDSHVVGQIAVVVNVLALALLAHRAVGETFTVLAAGEGLDGQARRIRESLVLHAPLAGLFLSSLVPAAVALGAGGTGGELALIIR